MRPITVTQASVASSAWIPIDSVNDYVAVGIGCVVTGTVNYTVEHTYMDIFNASVTPIAFPHATIAAKTANADGSYTSPIRALRLTVNSGTGSVTATILQGIGK